MNRPDDQLVNDLADDAFGAWVDAMEQDLYADLPHWMCVAVPPVANDVARAA